ncbi:SNF7 family protein [Cardiosporidium cionae]|uniref:SNF7 family protein n=1 Tax=Cardiosporidium cionae TaxID=476202 RepID=A0ABQ7JB83_9APIC|nr:SNF7 family protein [Cardiosporidium cionae]|eukprot:KAF8821246.1 SNF7 family protein [Cardiosporidium cionae]
MAFGIMLGKSLDDTLREHKRSISRSIRELDRERMSLEKQEKDLEKTIKQEASKGRMSSVRIMAKDLVRIRKHCQKFYEMRSHLQAISLRLQTVKSSNSMADSMKDVSKMMVKVNKRLDIPNLQKIMKKFMQESEKLGLTDELMGDTLENAMDDGDALEEEDAVVEKTLAELGVDMSAELMKANPTNLPALKVQQEDADKVPLSTIEKDLDDRLKNLKG